VIGNSRFSTGVGLTIPFGPLTERLCGSLGHWPRGSTRNSRGWSRPRRAPRASWLTVVVVLPLLGCGHAPLRPDQLGDPALVPIRAAFERTLAEARADPAVSWQSGWLGNASINLFGGTRRGLCYEWRNLIYDGVIEAVHRVGWDATGVVISKGTYSEHSAVVVYDPRRIPLDEILSADPGRPVYVLDAWRRGDADIYPMRAWLSLPIIVRSPAQIKPLPVRVWPGARPAAQPARPTAA
jgi:hypothetical protein